jgi:hypothetical protein
MSLFTKSGARVFIAPDESSGTSEEVMPSTEWQHQSLTINQAHLKLSPQRGNQERPMKISKFVGRKKEIS